MVCDAHPIEDRASRIEYRTLVKQTKGLLGGDIAENSQPFVRLKELDHVGVLAAIGQNVRELVGHFIEPGLVEDGAGLVWEQGDVEDVPFHQILEEMRSKGQLRH